MSTHEHDLASRVRQARVVMAGRRIEPPEEDRQRDVNRAGNLAAFDELFGAAGVHQDRPIDCRLVGGRRFETIEALRRETTAWQQHRNAKQRGVDWQFKVGDARIKLVIV